MRMTEKKRAILARLSEKGPYDFFEYGTPPYSASDVAESLHLDLSNTAKTLKAMERDGLVVREKALRSTWNAIAQGHMQRTRVCYWCTATMERDRAAAEDWRAGVKARSEAALKVMFAPSAHTTPADL